MYYETETSPNTWTGSLRVSTLYYAGHQRAVRLADDDLDGTLDSQTRYFYDDDWNLLEQRQDEQWVAPSGFGFPLEVADVTANFTHRTTRQFVWDPLSKNQLIAQRWSLSEPTPAPDTFTERAWSLVDRGHNVIALVPEVQAGGSYAFRVNQMERVRYSAYGVPRLEQPADLNASGAVDIVDYTAFSIAWNDSLGHPDYRADIDVNLNGTIDIVDLTSFSAAMGAGTTPVEGVLTGSLGNPIGYGGGEYDAALEQWCMRFRWYDAWLGRFVTRDPAGYVDGMSLYLYANANPLMYFDPMGLWGNLSFWEFMDYLVNGVPAGQTGIESPGTAVGKGLVTGCKAATNSAATSLTLGLAGDVEVFTPTAEDIENGYHMSRAVTGIGTEIGVGLMTGSLATKPGMVGKFFFGADMATNANALGESIGDMSVNGVTWSNGLQFAAAAGGMGGGVAAFAEGTSSARAASSILDTSPAPRARPIGAITDDAAIPDTLARVYPHGVGGGLLGPPSRADVFVTPAADIAGMNMQQIATRLSIPESPTGAFDVIEFPTPLSGLASPINRTDPGFIGGGFTAGGAREFVIPNGPIPDGAMTRIVR